jgi:hypothetical protein
MKKLTLQQLSETCAKHGVEFIDEKYRGTTFRHNFKCIKHHKVQNTCLESLLKKKSLNCCIEERNKKLQRDLSDINFIKQISISKGFEFMDEEYLGINHQHFFKCLAHDKILKSTFKHIRKGQVLKCCLANKVQARKKTSEDSIALKMSKKGLRLVGTFKGMHEMHFVKCINHNFTKLMKLSLVLSKNHKTMPCCRKVLAMAETQTKPKDSAEINKIKQIVKQESEYTCKVCRMKELMGTNCVAHEIDPRKDGKENYICLCGNCNIVYRKKYGYKNNTKEQMDDFVEEYGKDPGGEKARLKKIDWKR